MEAKTSKAMSDVWEAKNRIYEELKEVPVLERTKYILEKTKEVVLKLKQAKKFRNG